MATEKPQDETVKNRIVVLLQRGYSRAQLINDFGFAERTVDNAIKNYKEQGGEETEKEPSSSQVKDKTMAIRKEKESVLPEWLENDVAEIFDGNIRDRKLFMAGMSVPLMGLRIFGETAPSIVELITVWQRGQIETARALQGGGAETAKVAAQEVLSQSMPQILGAVKDSSVNTSTSPMQGMMVRLFEPYLQNIMAKFGGLGMLGMMPMGGQAQTSPGTQPGPQAPGTTGKVSKDEIKEVFNDD